MPPTGGVRISTREIYDQLLVTDRKVDELIATNRTKDHEDRIRFLERAAWGLPVTLIVAVAGAVIR